MRVSDGKCDILRKYNIQDSTEWDANNLETQNSKFKKRERNRTECSLNQANTRRGIKIANRPAK